MPIKFPHLDADGNLVDVLYWTLEESAEKLHVSQKTLREKCRREIWPHLRVAHRNYFNAEQLARIVEMESVNPDAIPESATPLSVVLDPDEAEGGVR